MAMVLRAEKYALCIYRDNSLNFQEFPCDANYLSPHIRKPFPRWKVCRRKRLEEHGKEEHWRMEDFSLP
jgi:hypothetical protein